MPAVVITAALALLGLTVPATPAHARQRVSGPVLAVTIRSEPLAGSNAGWFERAAISTIDSRTARIRPLASGFGPRFSPGGRLIAYCRGGLWVMRSNGSQAVRFTRKHCESLTWAPDGRAIAFSDGHDIFRVARRGGPVLRIGAADEAGVIAPPRCASVVDETGEPECTVSRNRLQPSWSSRDLIAFTEYRTVTPGGLAGEPSVVAVMRPDGTELRRLTGGREDHSPDWAPDGRRLAFVRGGREFGDGSIHSIDDPGGALRRLTRGRDPAWSPTGTRIAFTRRAFSSFGGFGPLYFDLLVMPDDGGTARRIGRATSRDADVRGRQGPERSFAEPAWRPVLR